MTSHNRSGFSLVEVVVTVVLLGIVLSSLGRMSTVYLGHGAEERSHLAP